MARSLPSQPSLEHLKKEAKAVLAAQRAGNIDGCRQLGLLGRWSHATESELLKARVSLQDAQMAVALDYGFTGWAALKGHVETARAAIDEQGPDGAAGKGSTCGDAARLFKQLQDDPLHQRSQMYALMVAMRAMGRHDADYATLMAVSGWSGQFVYVPKPDWPTFIEPGPTVQRACTAMGITVELRRAGSPEEAFDFISEACAGDQAVLAEHLEFGLFVGVEKRDKPLVRFFVCPFFNDGVWWSREQFAETWWGTRGDKRLFRLSEPAEPRDPEVVAREVLSELVRLATADYWTDWRKNAAPDALTGLRAIERYASDVAEVSHAMQDSDGTNKATCFFERGWGCYAIYPQWTARECTARYLERAADLFDPAAAKHMRIAAKGFREAYRAWQAWEPHLGRSEKLGRFDERWANPQHRNAGSEAVLSALEHERAAIASVERALSAIEEGKSGMSEDQPSGSVQQCRRDRVLPTNRLRSGRCRQHGQANHLG